MKANIVLGKIMGIRIGLHYSWLLIAWLLAVSLVLRFEALFPHLTPSRLWLAAILVDLLFFVTLVAHELAHAWVALRRGLPVRSITLFALGGVAHIERDPEEASTELAIGLAGPLASVAMGVMLLLLAVQLGGDLRVPSPNISVEGCRWLGTINVVLAIFNMLPGYPLDGGRVLRAVLWALLGSAERATYLAARLGQVAGYGMLALGLVLFVGNAGFSGLWLAMVGWFLADAARQSRGHAYLQARLRGAVAADVLRRDVPLVEAAQPLQAFIHERLVPAAGRGFGVVSGGRVRGWITREQVKMVEQPLWPATCVGDVMQELEKVRAVSRSTPLMEVCTMLAEDDEEQIPVIDEGTLHGMVTRSDLIEYVRARAANDEGEAL